MIKNLTKKTKKGFTLIELIAVIAIIGIIALVVVPNITNKRDQARNSGVIQNINSVRGSLENIMAHYDEYNNANKVADRLNNELSDTVKNPFDSTKTKTYEVSAADTVGKALIDTNAASVLIVDSTNSAKVDTALAGANNKELKGTIVVVVDSTNRTYTIFGVDNVGTKLNSSDVK